MTTDRQNIVQRVLGWLRAGYPQGVPTGDYVALLGLLHRRLTTTEIEQIAATLAAEGDLAYSEERIREAVATAVKQVPDEQDIARVRAHLAAGGWPLASPDDAPESDLRS